MQKSMKNLLSIGLKRALELDQTVASCFNSLFMFWRISNHKGKRYWFKKNIYEKF